MPTSTPPTLEFYVNARTRQVVNSTGLRPAALPAFAIGEKPVLRIHVVDDAGQPVAFAADKTYLMAAGPFPADWTAGTAYDKLYLYTDAAGVNTPGDWELAAPEHGRFSVRVGDAYAPVAALLEKYNNPWADMQLYYEQPGGTVVPVASWPVVFAGSIVPISEIQASEFPAAYYDKAQIDALLANYWSKDDSLPPPDLSTVLKLNQTTPQTTTGVFSFPDIKLTSSAWAAWPGAPSSARQLVAADATGKLVPFGMGFIETFEGTPPGFWFDVNLWAANLSGYNTGDETLDTIKTKLGITTLSGSNTGDETLATIKTKLGISVLSGRNTGDENDTTIKTKLGISVLSGSNTGDETDTTIKTKLGISVLSGSNTGDVSIATASRGLTVAGQALSLSFASASTPGVLSAADWSTFNNKQAADPTIVKGTTIAVGAVAFFTDTSAVAGDEGLWWDFDNYGLSVSGEGYFEPTSTLHVQGSFSTKVAYASGDPQSLGRADHVVLVPSTRTLVLPDAASCPGRQYVIKVTATATVATITTTSLQTIDGASSVELAQIHAGITVCSDGSNWFIIGRV